MRKMYVACMLPLTLGCGASRPPDPPVTEVVIAAPLDAGARASAEPTIAARAKVLDTGNSLPLGTAGLPFAKYLSHMHTRIHPIFTDDFLAKLGSSSSDPLNDPTMYTILEIVLTADGSVGKIGVVKTSGVTAFDVAAIDSVMRAAPFGATPAQIRSPDEDVYMRWEFHRDPVLGCSTVGVTPLLLRSAPGDP